MKIKVNVLGGSQVKWGEIIPLQPFGFKEQSDDEKSTLKNSILSAGFHDAFDVWEHEGRIYSIDGVHRKIALMELISEGHEVPELLPCNYIIAETEAEAAGIVISRNSSHSHIVNFAAITEAYMVPSMIIDNIIPQKNKYEWGLLGDKDADLESFFEEKTDEQIASETGHKIVLQYNEVEYEAVMAAFDKLVGTKEQVVFRLLGLDEDNL